MLKTVKETDDIYGGPPLIDILNELLSDRDFFEFLEDVSFKSSQVKAVLSGNFDRSHMGNINVEGYFIWDLQKHVESFILSQLVKRGLSIEER